LAAEVHMIDLRRKNTVRRMFGLDISVSGTFWGASPRSASSTESSLIRYPVIAMPPHARCLGLSQRHPPYKEGSPKTLTTGGGYGRFLHGQTCVGNHTETNRGYEKNRRGCKSASHTPFGAWTSFLPGASHHMTRVRRDLCKYRALTDRCG
jgi:hypothetical protein